MSFDKRNIEYLTYDILNEEDKLLAYTFTRKGGVGENEFESLNLSNNVGDHPQSVNENRKIVQDFIKAKKLVFSNQVHQDDIIEITQANLEKLPSCDALVTKLKDIALVITHADCQACLLYDRENQIIAAIHAGWKGLTKNIYAKTVNFLIDKGSKPENIIVCISPSLKSCHSEFRNFKKELPESFWSYEKEEKHFDLLQIAIDQLKDAKILEKNIEVADICTYCKEDEYFSYRRNNKTGRNATIIMLKN
ncbi:MAG: Laccase domain protein YfiH [Candidatus Anoxychlamydiales bacterium]|nr:Laccase domain protein YfiH [Candidatus Anoxychlamydiales bacterium]